MNQPQPHADLERHKVALVAYLKSKLDQEDWHGVRDAACDIEVLEAQMRCMATLPQISSKPSVDA